MLEGWTMKKQLASAISNPAIDKLYEIAMNRGAWGGKMLGAGGAGCLMMLAPVNRRAAVVDAFMVGAKARRVPERLRDSSRVCSSWCRNCYQFLRKVNCNGTLHPGVFAKGNLSTAQSSQGRDRQGDEYSSGGIRTRRPDLRRGKRWLSCPRDSLGCRLQQDRV